MLCTGSELCRRHTCKKLRQLDDPVPKQLPPLRAAKTLTRTHSVCRDGGVPAAR